MGAYWKRGKPSGSGSGACRRLDERGRAARLAAPGWLARPSSSLPVLSSPSPPASLLSSGPCPPSSWPSPESGYSPFSLKTCSSWPTHTQGSPAPPLHFAPATFGHYEQPSPEAVHVRAQAPQALRAQPETQGRPRTTTDPCQRGEQEVNTPASVTESLQARKFAHPFPFPSLINFCKSTPDHLVSDPVSLHFVLCRRGGLSWRSKGHKSSLCSVVCTRQRFA